MTQFRIALVVAIAIVALLSCSRLSSTAGVVAASAIINGQDFPDPAVLQSKDGGIFAYATQGRAPSGQFVNVQAAYSKDAKSWDYVGEVFPVKPSWANATQNFWAPHVSFADGRYFMYFSAEANATKEFCIGVATSESPRGPFRDQGAPLVCGSGFQNIDPMAFDDPVTGARLLYWGSGFGAIKVQPLARDRVSFQAGSTAREILFPAAGADDYRKLIEGAWVTLHDGFYYLFFSGDDCCTIPHYAVMVARSRSATGPFEFKAGERREHIILESREGFYAPGHNSLLDVAGKTKVFFHAMLRPADPKAPRTLVVRDIEWRDGWPVVVTKD